ncbi:MAG: L-threonylcarbamoyladenylate synthase [Xenococcaceae cyanobacterium MO_188.B32]|nr:L-threonylcarbamoyladenylate synthase [Xenococcaceae cyanobacterium MO_188.B32]
MPEVSLSKLITKAIAGEVVSFPTDTVPALAVKPESAQKVFTIKQRPATKPLILMAASVAELLPYVSGTEKEIELWQHTANQYLPGAITFILPASSQVPKPMNPLDPTTIGVRVPNCSIALEILRQTGALATTSANISGEAPLTEMSAIANAFPEVFALAETEFSLETSPSGKPSTVVKWSDRSWTVLRQGSVDIASSN